MPIAGLLVMCGGKQRSEADISRADSTLTGTSSIEKEPFFSQTVCSFGCSNSFDDIAQNCVSKDNLLSYLVKPHEDLNPYELFSDLVTEIKKQAGEYFDLNYTFGKCNAVCSAAATVDKSGRQLVYYNENYLKGISGTSAKMRWTIYAVFAHEIGHQILGHTHLDYKNLSTRERRVNELRADFFSGYVMRYLASCTENDVVAGINSLDPLTYRPKNAAEEAVALYPTMEKRRLAAVEGFRRQNVIKIDSMFGNIRATAIKAKIPIILRKVDYYLTANNIPEALKVIDAASVNDSRDSSTLLNMKAICKMLQHDNAAAEALLQKAVELAPNEIEYHKNVLKVTKDKKVYDQSALKIRELSVQ